MRAFVQTLATAALVAVVGCNPSPTAPSAEQRAAATPEQWQEALVRAYQKLGPATTDEDGVTRSIGCFGESNAKKKCDALMNVEYDSFRKTRLLVPLRASIEQVTGETGIGPSIVLLENKLPVLVLRVQFAGDSWLFLKRVSILIDDEELALDQPIARDDRQTQVAYNGVREHASLIVKEAQFQNLRRIATAKKIRVRITGETGYTTVSPKGANHFRSDLVSALQAYDVLQAALPSPVRP